MGHGEGCTCKNVCLCILSLFLPPLAVFLKLAPTPFYYERPAYLFVVLVSVIILTLALWIPGMHHRSFNLDPFPLVCC